MRIAYVCMDRGVPVWGRTGSSIHVQEVIRAFRALGADVDLFAASADDEPPRDLAAVPVHRVPVAQEGPRAAREQWALAANRDLRAALENEQPFDLVYERYSIWGFAGMDFARETGVAGVLEVNAPLIEQQAEYRGLVDRSGAERIAAHVFEASRVLIALSSEIASYLAQYPGTSGRVEIIPDGVNPDRFPMDRKPTRPTTQHVWSVGFVGSLKPWHGLGTLVDAFARFHETYPDTRLVVVGDGPERPRLEAQAADLGVGDAVRLTGSVPPDEVPRLLASMDAAVAPYPNLPTFYFSPLKIFEYMAAGLPIVASRIGQIPAVIRDGTHGLLCPPGDAASVAAALGRLKEDPDLGAQLGRAARAHVLQHYTWKQVASRILHSAEAASYRDRAVPAESLSS